MIKRLLVALAALLVVAAAAASLILWYVLSGWVPTKGKALIIGTVERHAPVELAVDTVRYDWLRGIVLTNVEVTGRETRERWAAAPVMHVRVRWPALLVKQVVFKVSAPLAAPFESLLSVSGRYDQRTAAWTVEAQTDDVTLESLAAAALDRLPNALTAGTARLQVRADRPAGGRLRLEGRLTGTGVVWSAPAWRLAGNLDVTAQAQPPREPGARWDMAADVRLRDASLTGLPTVGAITEMDGTARITPDLVQVGTLTGVMLGSPWQVEGDVRLGPPASIEALITSTVDLGDAVAAGTLPRLPLELDGQAAVRAVCRGPLGPRAALDCLALAEVRDGALAGPSVPQPVRPVTARLAYDLLATELSVLSLDAQSGQASLSGRGTVVFRRGPRLDLQLRGQVPLAFASHWMPKTFPLQQLEGQARFDVRALGEPKTLVPTGRVDLQDAGGVIVPWSKTFEQLSGTLALDDAALVIKDMRGVLDGVPLNAAGSMSRDDAPRLAASVGFPHGRLRVAGRQTKDAVLLDDVLLELPTSRLTISGTLARQASQSSRLAASGTLRLEELVLVPFATLPKALEAWRLRGSVDLEARFNGRLSRAADAAIQARLRSAALQVRDLPLEDATCTIDQQDRLLRARVPSALVAGGPFTGELTLDQRKTPRAFLAEFDLVNLQLERLALAIPAWRGRTVTGQASSHAVVSGAWEDRPSWRGEGWLNASGEGLGELPLLDKLFRGLFGTLADRMGLDTLRRARITQAAVQWRLVQERVHTDTLRLGAVAGTEPVAIYATGSVGLDQTLDLTVEPELSEGVVLEAPTTATLATTVLRAAGQLERLRRLIGRHRLTGTIQQPEYRFELSSQDVIKQLAPGPADFLQNLFDPKR